MGVGWAGCWCWVTTVLVLSGRKRSAKLGSVIQGGREEGPELPPPPPPAAAAAAAVSAAAAAAAVLEPGPEK